VTIDEVGTVLYVGAGTMGCANSLVAAVAGYDVVLHDARAETLDAVSHHHDEIAAFLVEVGFCPSDDIAAARTRVSLAADLHEAIANADLISESVFEDLDLKREVHRALDQAAPTRTILTTNTSALLVSEIEDAVERGDRFAAMHSHLGSLLVDIVGGPRTSETTIDLLRRYVVSLGAVPLVLKKEHPGYVFNAMNGPVLSAAVELLLDDVADIETIDRTWMADRGAPMGPFGMIDLFGLDLVRDSWRRRSAGPDALGSRAVRHLTELIDAGRLGVKSGVGYYDYPDPSFGAPGFATAGPTSPVASEALRSALITSAIRLAAEEVASPEDIDMAWMAATGQEIGPFGVIEEVGVDRFLSMLGRQVEAGLMEHDLARWAADYLHDQVGG
jgi:enoyl-CoA hydratase/3-hydroxyacyl-CoA dehydrogenase